MKDFVTIVSLERIKPGWSRVTFDNGAVCDIEWSRYASEGTLYAPLADPRFSTKCRIAYGGDALRWPNGMDWSAGAVLKAGQPADLAVPLQPESQPRNLSQPAPRAVRSGRSAQGTLYRDLFAPRHK